MPAASNSSSKSGATPLDGYDTTACVYSPDHVASPSRFLMAPIRADADATSPPSIVFARPYHASASASSLPCSNALPMLSVNDALNSGSRLLASTNSAAVTASALRPSRASSFARSMRAKSAAAPPAVM